MKIVVLAATVLTLLSASFRFALGAQPNAELVGEIEQRGGAVYFDDDGAVTVHLRNADDTLAGRLIEFPLLRDLQVFDSSVQGSGWEGIGRLRQLEHVHIENTPLTTEGVRSLAKLPNLGSLALIDTAITDASFESLAKMNRLRDLYLHNNKNLRDPSLCKLKHLPNLYQLVITGGAIDDDDLRGLVEVANLKTLVLSNASITDAGLRHLESLVNLKRLYVKHTAVTDKGIHRLEQALPDTMIFY